MIQSQKRSFVSIAQPGALLLLCMLTALVSCEKSPAAAPAAKSPRIASLVPAATDLIVGMGAGDHLVAVSNWDNNQPLIRDLPRVGDYQTTDWEKLAALRPEVMIVFMTSDRMPAGIQQRADSLGIKIINVTTERVEDIFALIDQLGEILNEREKASVLRQSLRSRLDAVAARVKNRPRVRTLVARDEDSFALVAGNTFVDDLLNIAGGVNVAADFPIRYPTIDRERVIELAPQAVIQLLPEASPQVLERARQSWRLLPDLPAVRDGRVYILSDWYVIQPGAHIAELAEKFAESLHPQ